MVAAMDKQNLIILFGGQSSEHEISCMSAVNIIGAVDEKRYNIVLVGITKEGHWVLVDSMDAIKDGSWRESEISAVVSADATKKALYLFDKAGALKATVRMDVVFPVLHGLYGEDGTVQGLLELAHVPYVGCGVFASAASMDKFYTKVVVDDLGIRQADYVPVYAEELSDMDAVIARVEKKLSYPVFVKPSRAGSSKGVNKARDAQSLAAALREAADNDRKILVEETITGREVECAVLGNLDVKASGVGEILSADEFYNFEAKYYNPDSKTVVDPLMPDGMREQIRESAVAIFKALDGRGLSRVDFFLTDSGVVFNEINTLPGFTAISMYPTLWESAGIEKRELVQRLIDLAFTKDEADA